MNPLTSLAIRDVIRKWLRDVSYCNIDNTLSVQPKTCEEVAEDSVKIDALAMDIEAIISDPEKNHE